MTQDMKHNDMKRNNEMRDTVFTTRRHHGYCSGGFAIRHQQISGFAIL